MSAGAEPVGFIGLGNIGAPMATRLLDWPGGLVVHDVRAEATEPFVAEGATAAASPAELVSRASVVCIVVQDEDQVRGVLEGPDGILAGASPLEAVQLQLIVMYMLVGAVTFTGLIAAYLTYRAYFTGAHQLKTIAQQAAG